MPSETPEQNLPANGLSIRREWLEDIRACVVYVTGNIDWTNAPDLRLAITQCLAFDSPSQLIIDLGGVDRVDSSGVGSLVESWRNTNKKGIHFALCGVTGSLRRVMERIRLDTIFEIRPTPEDALWDTQSLGITW